MTRPQEALIQVRVTPELKARVEAAAKRSALTPADWVRAVLALAANLGAFAPKRRIKRAAKSTGG